MKNIFLDCGTHLCEGLGKFYNKGIIDSSYEIHTFEPNPACNVENRVKRLPLHINVHKKAVWVEDGVVSFFQENHKKSNSGSPSDGYSDIDGWGSSVDGSEFCEHMNDQYTCIQVESLDFNDFVDSLPKESNILCKMDIEGSEFKVLRRLINTGVIQKLNEIWVEFHEWHIPNENKESVTKITNDIIKLGVKFNLWY